TGARDGEGELAGRELVRLDPVRDGERLAGQVAGRDLQDRDVGVVVAPLELRPDGGAVREAHVDLVLVLDHVAGGDDRALARPDDPGRGQPARADTDDGTGSVGDGGGEETREVERGGGHGRTLHDLELTTPSRRRHATFGQSRTCPFGQVALQHDQAQAGA